MTPENNLWAWGALGAVVLVGSGVLAQSSVLFAPEVAFENLPIWPFVLGLMAQTGLVVWGLPKLIKAGAGTAVLVCAIGVGALARLCHLGAEPILETDFFRYLLDGAVVAQGLNPYQVSPQELIDTGSAALPGLVLTERGQEVLWSVNHPTYKTVYPPTAQAIFALAHWGAGYSLDALRVVLFVLECAALGVLVRILIAMGSSPLWAMMYWWNPLVIKEIANSAHMEPIVVLPVLLAFWTVLAGRPVWAALALALGAGAKLWPGVLMAPVVWPLRRRLWLAVAASVGFVAVFGLQVWPVVVGGLDESSGFVGFARHWSASSAAFLVATTLSFGQAPRVLLGLAMLACFAWLSLGSTKDQMTVVKSMALCVICFYLLSPSQTPWYFVWIAPILCLFPSPALMLGSALLPLHYSFFWFADRGLGDLYRYGVVWVIWLPVWAGLGWKIWRKRAFHAQG